MKKNVFWLWGYLWLGIFWGNSHLQAEIVGQWTLAGNAQISQPTDTGNWSNLTSGTAWGTNLAYVSDEVLGTKVLEIGGNSGILAGKTAAIQGTGTSTTAETHFSISFWVNSSANAANGTVMVGNRYLEDGSNNFIKLTNSLAGYYRGSTSETLRFSENLPAETWLHYTFVKSDGNMAVYVNGKPYAEGKVSLNLSAMPFCFGGDSVNNTNEDWQGKLSNVTVYNTALSAGEVRHLANQARTTILTNQDVPGFRVWEDFSSPEIDSAKWTVKNFGTGSSSAGGLPNTNVSNIAASVQDGELTLSGSVTANYWQGKTLESTEVFDASQQEITVTVDRVSLSATGTAGRSSLWFYNAEGDDGHFVQLSQNTYQNQSTRSWELNYYTDTENYQENVGWRSAADADKTDYGYHQMTMKHDGEKVWTYIDGQLQNVVEVDFQTFRLLLTGQARAAGDTVNAVFDNVSIATRTSALPIVQPTEDFSSEIAIGTDWIRANQNPVGVLQKTYYVGSGIDTQSKNLGILQLTDNHLRYATPFSLNQLILAVDRDSLATLAETPLTGAESGLQLWSDEDTYLTILQNSNTGNWALAWKGISLDWEENGFTTSGEEILGATDFFTHQIVLEALGLEGETVTMQLSIDGIFSKTFAIQNWTDDIYAVLSSGGWHWDWVGDPDRGYGPSQPGSWCYQILPFLEQMALYNLGSDGLPDDCSSSIQLAGAATCNQTPLGVFYCPSRRAVQNYPCRNSFIPRNCQSLTECAKADYATNHGDRAGILFRHSAIMLGEIRDGLSNTYLLGEKAMNPQHYTTGDCGGDNETLYGGAGADVMRSTYSVPNQEDSSTANNTNRFFRPMRDKEGLEMSRTFGSCHSGAWGMAMCDGSVHRVAYAIDSEIHRNLGHRRDGQVVSLPPLR
ncbi:MAG: DUF1559 domain-containing protein [Planctomycetia bacterium]|nr:DUF1559 domain-containing protein [Planctomycetia bacterium]